MCAIPLDVLFFPFSARFTTLAVTLLQIAAFRLGVTRLSTAVEGSVTFCSAFRDWFVLSLDLEGLWWKLVAQIEEYKHAFGFLRRIYFPDVRLSQ